MPAFTDPGREAQQITIRVLGQELAHADFNVIAAVSASIPLRQEVVDECINLVVLIVSADDLHVDDAQVECDCHNQAEIIAFDVEHYTPIRDWG